MNLDKDAVSADAQDALTNALAGVVARIMAHTLKAVIVEVRAFARQESDAAWANRWAFSEHSYAAHQLNLVADAMEDMCKE